jgi:hypothetical protein
MALLGLEAPRSGKISTSISGLDKKPIKISARLPENRLAIITRIVFVITAANPKGAISKIATVIEPLIKAVIILVKTLILTFLLDMLSLF